MYLESSQRDLERCATARREGDATALRIAAHSLKGSSAGIGATSLSQQADRLEKLAAAGDTEAAHAAIRALQALNAEVRAALQRWNTSPDPLG